MWKYVGRRLKDTAELTYNLRSTFSTCSPEALRAKQKASQVPSSQDDHDKYIRKCSQPNQQLKRNPFITDKQWVIEEYYRNQKQKQQQQQAFNGWLELGLLKWSASVVCSLYIGQLICFYSRKRQNLKRWHHMEQILAERSLRQIESSKSNLFDLDECKKSSYSSVPSSSGKQSHWFDADQMQMFRTLIPISNDHLQEDATIAPPISVATQTETSIHLDDAIDLLKKTSSNIEFKLGVQNVIANEVVAAASHFKLATIHGHAGATYNLGVFYETGNGVEKNMKLAMECYRKAAKLGHKKAMYNLGVFYALGTGGLKKDHSAALACFKEATRLGLREAQIALSNKPRNVPKQDDEVFLKQNDLITGQLSAVHV